MIFDDSVNQTFGLFEVTIYLYCITNHIDNRVGDSPSSSSLPYPGISWPSRLPPRPPFFLHDGVKTNRSRVKFDSIFITTACMIIQIIHLESHSYLGLQKLWDRNYRSHEDCRKYRKALLATLKTYLKHVSKTSLLETSPHTLGTYPVLPRFIRVYFDSVNFYFFLMKSLDQTSPNTASYTI